MFDVSFNGIGNVGEETYLKGSGITAENLGHVAKVSANKTVDVCEEGDEFCGVIKQVDTANEIVSLKRKGFEEVPYSGSPALGWTELVADGDGGVKNNTSGTSTTAAAFHVVDINSTDGLLTMDLG